MKHSTMISYFGQKSSCLVQSGFCHGLCKDSGKPQEPKGPKIITDLPGSKTKQLIEQLKPFQNISNIELFAQYGKSLGNYLQDVDGNVLLDLNMQLATSPLGYNSTELKKVYQDSENIHNIINRPVLEIFPCDCWPGRIENIIKKVSTNLPNISMYSCESTTIENAFESMMISFQKHQRDGAKLTLEQLKNVFKKDPSSSGSPKLSILSFKNSDHGNTMGALSASNAISKARAKLDVAAFDWPVAHYPSYRYPLEQCECYNAFQDDKSLDMVKDLINKWDNKDMPVVGVVVEPIQSECTQCPSAKFFQSLQDLTNEIGIYLMFDETKTGCGSTGKFWCIENFCLRCPVDILAFGGKTQISGFLHSEDLNLREPGHISDNWMRDPAKLIAFEAIVATIEKFNLLENVRKTGKKLQTRLLDMESEYYDLIHSTRGLGTFLAFNAQCPRLRDDIWKRLRKKGILCGKCGDQGITIRPSLTFNEGHANIFLDKLEEVIKETVLINPTEKDQSKKPASPPKCGTSKAATKEKTTETKKKISNCDYSNKKVEKKSATSDKTKKSCQTSATKEKMPTEKKKKSNCDFSKKEVEKKSATSDKIIKSCQTAATKEKIPAEKKKKSNCDFSNKKVEKKSATSDKIIKSCQTSATKEKMPTEKKKKSNCDFSKKEVEKKSATSDKTIKSCQTSATKEKIPAEKKKKSNCDFSKKEVEKKSATSDKTMKSCQPETKKKCSNSGTTKEDTKNDDQCKKKIRKWVGSVQKDKKKRVCPKSWAKKNDDSKTNSNDRCVKKDC